MKLHLGCGDKYLELENGGKYKHVDLRDGKHIDYVTDVRDLSMFEDNSIEEIYACHLLEHIKRNEEIAVLEEWHRVLMSGGRGVLRIAVPNFAAIVEEYQSNNNLGQLMGLLYGGQNYEYNFHYQTFDRRILEEKLRSVGFIDIQEYDWREFLPEGYDDFSRAYLPHMDFEHGRLMSLNLIAKKR